MINTKKRHLEIYNSAVRVMEIFGGIETIDALSQEERIPQLRKMARMVKELSDCHNDSAKRNIAKAMRRARYGIMKDKKKDKDWGGKRPGAGRPSKPN